MKSVHIEVGKTKSGGHKVYIWGQPDDHIMDWRGSNYHIATVPGQPLRGFPTFEAAHDFALKLGEEAILEFARTANGSFFGEERDLKPVKFQTKG